MTRKLVLAVVGACILGAADAGSPPSDVLAMGGGVDNALSETIRDGVWAVPGTDMFVSTGNNNVKTWARAGASVWNPQTAIALTGNAFTVSATHVFAIDDSIDTLRSVPLASLGDTPSSTGVASAVYSILKYSVLMDGLVYLDDDTTKKIVVMDTDGTARSASNYEYTIAGPTPGGTPLDIVPSATETAVFMVFNEEIWKVTFSDSASPQVSKVAGSSGAVVAGAFSNGDESSGAYNSAGDAACTTDPAGRNLLCFYDDISRILTFDLQTQYLYAVSTTQLDDYTSLAVAGASGDVIARFADDGDMVLNPISGQDLTASSCEARVLAAIDRSTVRWWTEQYRSGAEHLEALIDQLDDKIGTNGVRIGVVEMAGGSNVDRVTIDSGNDASKSSLDTLANTMEGETGFRSRATDFAGLFTDYASTLHDTDVNSYIFIASDLVPGRRRDLRNVLRAVDNMKNTLANPPKVICLQTWRRVSTTRMSSAICDAKWIIRMEAKTPAVFATEVQNYICGIDDDDKQTNPCTGITNANTCRGVRRTSMGLAPNPPSDPGYQQCSWSRRGCSVKNKYAGIYN